MLKSLDCQTLVSFLCWKFLYLKVKKWLCPFEDFVIWLNAYTFPFVSKTSINPAYKGTLFHGKPQCNFFSYILSPGLNSY